MSCLNQSAHMQRLYHYSPRCMSQPWACQYAWTSHLMILAHLQHNRKRTSLRLSCPRQQPYCRWPLGCTAFASGPLGSASSEPRFADHYQHGIMLPMASPWLSPAHSATLRPSNPLHAQKHPDCPLSFTENPLRFQILRELIPLDS